MKSPLFPGERLLERRAANVFVGWLSHGGWLYLTTQRLIHEPNIIQFRKKIEIIDRQDIAAAKPCDMHFLGLIPICSTCFIVRFKDGRSQRFGVWDRTQWCRWLTEKPIDTPTTKL